MPTLPQFGVTSLVLALVTVLLVFAIYAYLGEARESLAGFWVGDPQFMVEAGLTGLALQVEPGQLCGFYSILGGAKHEGWLLMETPDGYICNQKVTIRTYFDHGFQRSAVYETGAAIEFADPASQLHVRISPKCGSLAIDSGDELLGLFRKDHSVSAPFSCGKPAEEED
jgi:hypothetical protein